jgi:trehalose 6-phosphate phosphatase
VNPGPTPNIDDALDPGRTAWFLDIDGTLLEIAATPVAVHVPDAVIDVLLRLRQDSQGALALISGRSLEQIDAGFERRDFAGRIFRPELQPSVLDDARGVLASLAAQKAGLVLEDKEHALAMHYRLAPALEADARAAVEALAQRLHPLFAVQGGKSVWELKPAGYSKRQAIQMKTGSLP